MPGIGVLQVSGRAYIPGIRNDKTAALVKFTESGDERMIIRHFTKFIAERSPDKYSAFFTVVIVLIAAYQLFQDCSPSVLFRSLFNQQAALLNIQDERGMQ
jgi:hypothetical protein